MKQQVVIRQVLSLGLAFSIPVAAILFIPDQSAQAALWPPSQWFVHSHKGGVPKVSSKGAEKARRDAEKAQLAAQTAQKKADIAARRAHELALSEAIRAEALAKEARKAADAIYVPYKTEEVASSAASEISSVSESDATEENLSQDAPEETAQQSQTAPGTMRLSSAAPASNVDSSNASTSLDSEKASSNIASSPVDAPISTRAASSTQAVSNAPATSSARSLWKPTGWLKPGDPSEKKPEAEKQANPTPWNPITWFGGGKQEPVKAETEAVHAAALAETSEAPPAVVAEQAQAAIIETEKGNISIELYPDQAPVTVANFAKLANEGFYGKYNMKFHRVIPGFVIQTGDPTGTGAGGSKRTIPLEAKNKLSHNAKGVVAMARGADPGSASSQFYITLTPQTALDGKYAIFGKVVGGMDVLDKIEKDDMLYGVRIVPPSSLTRDPQPEKKKFFSSLL